MKMSGTSKPALRILLPPLLQKLRLLQLLPRHVAVVEGDLPIKGTTFFDLVEGRKQGLNAQVRCAPSAAQRPGRRGIHS